MSDFNTKKCDNCGKIKLESNGWYQIRADTNPFCIVINHLGEKTMLLQDMSMSNKRLDTSTIYDVCGQTCLIEKISKVTGDIGYVGSNEHVNQGRD